jgi:hypothetical protein
MSKAPTCLTCSKTELELLMSRSTPIPSNSKVQLEAQKERTLLKLEESKTGKPFKLAIQQLLKVNG